MKELFSYLDALAANNNREWFAAHREEYDRLRLLKPLNDFLNYSIDE